MGRLTNGLLIGGAMKYGLEYQLPFKKIYKSFNSKKERKIWLKKSPNRFKVKEIEAIGKTEQ
jgi:hypothetical protein